MAEAIEFQKMRKDLAILYAEFIKSPDDKDTQSKIMEYENEYGGLQVYNGYLKSQPIPTDIETALSILSDLYQYGMWKDTHEYLSNEKLINKAKKVLEDLKKSEQ